jgi:hypothetical protein
MVVPEGKTKISFLTKGKKSLAAAPSPTMCFFCVLKGKGNPLLEEYGTDKLPPCHLTFFLPDIRKSE